MHSLLLACLLPVKKKPNHLPCGAGNYSATGNPIIEINKHWKLQGVNSMKMLWLGLYAFKICCVVFFLDVCLPSSMGGQSPVVPMSFPRNVVQPNGGSELGCAMVQSNISVKKHHIRPGSRKAQSLLGPGCKYEWWEEEEAAVDSRPKTECSVRLCQVVDKR